MDRFFTQSHCDRCHEELNGGRIMSMFNEDCLCMACKEKERTHPNYQKAVKTDQEEIQKGNYNFKGIGL